MASACLKRKRPGYRLSHSGAELVASYRRDAKNNDWVVHLARLLVSREPTTSRLAEAAFAGGARVWCLRAPAGSKGPLKMPNLLCLARNQRFLFATKPDNLVPYGHGLLKTPGGR